MYRQYKEAMGDGRPEFQRLSTNVVPINYKITLIPDLDKFVFDGEEVVQVQIKKPTKTIVLHSLDIIVKSAYYQHADSKQKEEGRISYGSTVEETAIFTFSNDLKQGNGSLFLTFSGELNNKMKGFYRSQYTKSDGTTAFNAVTHFEATDARRAFPCCDEPAVKATFDISMIVPHDKTALSNMPVKSDVPSSDKKMKTVTFDTTPIMSTYLIAFTVGDYDYVEGTDADGILVRIYTPAGKKEQGRFALDVAVKTLPFYYKYFGIKYMLPKIDLLSVADFAIGAMENWGLLTFKEALILVDPENSSAVSKQHVALVVGHELAHQWFGNLVTMDWWTDLWLKEGFATWIEYLCVDYCFPQWDIWTAFVNDCLIRAVNLDCLHNSHPIEVKVGHPSEIDEIFDGISYSKGASIIRMLSDYLGNEDFRKGLNIYLNRHAYKNAETEDLWQALAEASGKPVKSIMDTWTKQMGYPVLKVERKQESEKCILNISQNRFLADGKIGEGEDLKWLVPISITTSTSPTTPVKTILLDQDCVTVELPGVTQSQWVKINSGSVGVYRVQYTTDMLHSLIPAIKDKTLPCRDRLGLEEDLFALSRAGFISTVDVLTVIEAYTNETVCTVWNTLSSNLSSLANILQYTEYFDIYKQFVRKLFKPIAQKLGWEDKTGVDEAILRGIVLNKVGRYGDEATVTEARKRFKDHVSGIKPLAADLRGCVYGTVLTHGDEEVFNQMMQLYEKAELQQEQRRILMNLGSIQDEKLIQKVLDLAISDKIRYQDTPLTLGGTTGTIKGRDLAWIFLKTHWNDLKTRYKCGLLTRLVQAPTSGFATEEMAREIEAFFQANPSPGTERTVQQVIENTCIRAAWLEREKQPVGDWLKKNMA
ncbi:hypothetical protein LOTGIDRAFT_202512 [Lottia gigantea]|uniref:Aminopeptidase n=1 Tax=Lottia gigantea TaxID=225164 RepID=V4AGZ2_LOTGI|nr:hypothetical protein LOTGIDRAFT_202512 [Lottia gigantea]ESO94410.1 hypothetical protein LOTGIDRAFT_202512 [Lottia gigantea]